MDPIVRLLILGVAGALLASAVYALVPALRADPPGDDFNLVSLHAVLRAAAGAAALWAAAGGGVVAGWAFVAMLVAHTASAELARRRATG